MGRVIFYYLLQFDCGACRHTQLWFALRATTSQCGISNSGTYMHTYNKGIRTIKNTLKEDKPLNNCTPFTLALTPHCTPFTLALTPHCTPFTLALTPHCTSFTLALTPHCTPFTLALMASTLQVHHMTELSEYGVRTTSNQSESSQATSVMLR